MLAGCSSSSGGSTSLGSAYSVPTDGTPLDKDTATCATWSSAGAGDQFATANVNLRYLRAVNDSLMGKDSGLPTRGMVEQLMEATSGYCGADQATENVLTVQTTIVSDSSDDYLGSTS